MLEILVLTSGYWVCRLAVTGAIGAKSCTSPIFSKFYKYIWQYYWFMREIEFHWIVVLLTHLFLQAPNKFFFIFFYFYNYIKIKFWPQYPITVLVPQKKIKTKKVVIIIHLQQCRVFMGYSSEHEKKEDRGSSLHSSF